jgi:hypothetical protein
LNKVSLTLIYFNRFLLVFAEMLVSPRLAEILVQEDKFSALEGTYVCPKNDEN